MRKDLKTVAVFSGSNFGRGDHYIQAAKELGTYLGANGIDIVYGGTTQGLMGVMADAALAAGGTIHGVITRRLLDKGQLHAGLTTHEITDHMTGRKQRMAVLADAFIALPGGIGTLEEFSEIWSLNLLGELNKPAALYNIAGYFDRLMQFVDRMIAEEFLPAVHRQGIVISDRPAALIEKLRMFEPVAVPKWLGRQVKT
jgi:uncharacterized protein (TIGR00730 family)